MLVADYCLQSAFFSHMPGFRGFAARRAAAVQDNLVVFQHKALRHKHLHVAGATLNLVNLLATAAAEVMMMFFADGFVPSRLTGDLDGDYSACVNQGLQIAIDGGNTQASCGQSGLAKYVRRT